MMAASTKERPTPLLEAKYQRVRSDLSHLNISTS